MEFFRPRAPFGACQASTKLPFPLYSHRTPSIAGSLPASGWLSAFFGVTASGWLGWGREVMGFGARFGVRNSARPAGGSMRANCFADESAAA